MSPKKPVTTAKKSPLAGIKQSRAATQPKNTETIQRSFKFFSMSSKNLFYKIIIFSEAIRAFPVINWQ